MTDQDNCHCDGTGFIAMFVDVRGAYGNTVTTCSYGKALLVQRQIRERLQSLPLPAQDDENAQRERLFAVALCLSKIEPVSCCCGVMQPDRISSLM